MDADLAWVPVVADDAPPDPSGRWWHAEQGSLLRPWLWPVGTGLVTLVAMALDVFGLRDELGWRLGAAVTAALTVGLVGIPLLVAMIVMTIRRRRDRWVVVDDDRVRAGLTGHVPIAQIERLAIHRGFPRTYLITLRKAGIARGQLTYWDPALVKVKADRGRAPFLLLGTSHPDALVAALQHARRRAGLPAVPVTDDDGPYVLGPGSTAFDIPPPAPAAPSLPPPPPPAAPPSPEGTGPRS